ncbi:MAG: type II toxin-antitoxin system VapC family toxin [Acidimicrobiia bacterium]|nr:type II toxin-antitoxin system VapC family toxin [bacterium]MXX65335.1 type II toxin-antitoxin system VapC family toxin [Acidimicrobiia bacterium]MCY3579740.1 type II toxin-antitoxin system VapC family toxin [bacterium]MCY3652951.1 type II toxin-antitoxin system VapC family toxin [bacterium]MDE0643081.1 type II toxin-antitoxin system VapC family toxin [bacterium]
MLLLDTNALLWVTQDNPRLCPRALKIIREGWYVDSVAVSVVTFWEIAMLAERNRLNLECTPARWRCERLEEGLRELPLHGTEAVHAVALGREGFHQDPADRFIVATAILGGHTLLTTDRKILAWPGHLNRINVSR